MNPFVTVLVYDGLSFCKPGCGACIGELRSRMRFYAGTVDADEWQILAALQPGELVSAPHWEHRLRHLVGRQGLSPNPVGMNTLLRGWLTTAEQTGTSSSGYLQFVDFLAWNICHIARERHSPDEALVEAVIRRLTADAARMAALYFRTGEFDSLVESLLIIRNEDGMYAPELDKLLGLPWSAVSRTGRVLQTWVHRYSEMHPRQRVASAPGSRFAKRWYQTGRRVLPL